MRARTRVAVAVGLVVISVLVVLYTISNYLGPNNTVSKTPAPETALQVRDAAIGLIKVNYTPEDYVELTEEELEMFPELQAALQALEDSGKSEIIYLTSEQAAMAPKHYLEEKYQVQASCEQWCAWNHIFKYGENFYSIAVAHE